MQLFGETENRLNLSEGDVTYIPNFLDDNEARQLMHTLTATFNWQSREIILFGKPVMQPRLIAWIGDEGIKLRYSGIVLQPEPWPQVLLALRQKLQALTGTTFNGVLANLYRNGSDSMGWHSDDEAYLGANPVIPSLSLGAARRFTLKHKTKNEAFTLELQNGSLLLMQGHTQKNYKHALPKALKVNRPRINLTFRSILY